MYCLLKTILTVVIASSYFIGTCFSSEPYMFSPFVLNGSDEKPEAPVDPAGMIVHNHVILKVKDKVMTLMDVIHKMNILFFTYYEPLIDSVSARMQFYDSMWQTAFEATVDEFLMATDADEKKIRIESTDVKQEIIRIFGDKLTTFTDAFEMTYNDVYLTVFRMLISHKMMSLMVRSKASLSVTPKAVKERYAKFIANSSEEVNWRYSVLKIHACDSRSAFQLAEKIINRLNDSKVWDKERVKAIALASGGQVSFSDEFLRKDCDISDYHRQALCSIDKNRMVGDPVAYKDSYRLFVLHAKEICKPQSFASLENSLKKSLIEEKLVVFDKEYREKLRYRYGYDITMLPEKFSHFNGLFSWL